MRGRVPREKERTLGEGAMVFQVVMPFPENYVTYHHKVATSHPDLAFSVVRRKVEGNGMMSEEISVRGDHVPYELLDELRNGRGVRSVEPLESSGRYSAYLLILDVTPISKLAVQWDLRVSYPMRFEGGVTRFLVFAELEKALPFYDQLKALAPRTSMAAIRSEVLRRSFALLSERESQVLRTTLETGFWEPSHRVTLHQVARITRLAKSTLTRTMASIERKLLYHVADANLVRL